MEKETGKEFCLRRREGLEEEQLGAVGTSQAGKMGKSCGTLMDLGHSRKERWLGRERGLQAWAVMCTKFRGT